MRNGNPEPAGGRIPFWETEAFTKLLASADKPFYLYDLGLMRERAERLRNRLDPSILVYYAVKANPNPDLLRAMAACTDGADVSSGGELTAALKAGFRPERIHFAGPGKTDAELRAAVRAGIGAISVESPNELARLEAAAAAERRIADASVRVNPSLLIREFAIKMGGKSSAFGTDEERLPEMLDLFGRMPHVRPRGIHVYAGTQCLHAEALAENFRHTADIVRGALAGGKAPLLRLVNFGGGFGVPYHEGQAELDAESACDALNAEWAGLKKELNPADAPAAIIELGRWLTARAGLYAARVVDVKSSRGRDYAVLEGGMNHHLAASGNFGQVIRKNFRAANLSKPAGAETVEITAVGPLCTSIDVMGDRIRLAKPEIGDWIGIFDSGAYAYTASPLLFLSHPRPDEYAADPDGTARRLDRLPESGDADW
ncbi:MAG: pyridoxal-dependent decarboxylase, exosortase A system-associated [bacterium]|nr:pyridoxal-dependent decarboxylase, exosortase A system-associated [bacterium]